MFHFHRNVRNAKSGVVSYVPCSNRSLIISSEVRRMYEEPMYWPVFAQDREPLSGWLISKFKFKLSIC